MKDGTHASDALTRKDKRIAELESDVVTQKNYAISARKDRSEYGALADKFEKQLGESLSTIAKLKKENKQLRIAMDFLLRSPAGTVPKEADRFYSGWNATFQEVEE